MTKRGLAAKIPKIEDFERIKYQNLTLSGLTARAYSAYFGTPKRIIDVFNTLYCRGKEKIPSTGRISIASSQLVSANYLDLYQVEGSNWPLMAANLSPLHEMFEMRRARLDEDEKRRLERALTPDYEAAERFGMTEEEARGKAEYVPSPIKIQRYLNSASTLALLSLAKQQAPEFKEEREMLRRIKERGLGQAERKEEVVEEDLGSISAFSMDLALKTRVAIKGGEEPRNILFFKIVRLNHERREA
ncbi:MAG TPA: hypothetical protein VJI13_06775, partial [Candidatus Norongarragalinales archaeon]|nr:hypothetical protein [Candidatus Norongarragalinales archaeon]